MVVKINCRSSFCLLQWGRSVVFGLFCFCFVVSAQICLLFWPLNKKTPERGVEPLPVEQHAVVWLPEVLLHVISEHTQNESWTSHDVPTERRARQKCFYFMTCWQRWPIGAQGESSSAHMVEGWCFFMFVYILVPVYQSVASPSWSSRGVADDSSRGA